MLHLQPTPAPPRDQLAAIASELRAATNDEQVHRLIYRMLDALHLSPRRGIRAPRILSDCASVENLRAYCLRGIDRLSSTLSINHARRLEKRLIALMLAFQRDASIAKYGLELYYAR